MKRRALLGGLAAWPAIADAQAGKRPIGFVFPGSAELARPRVELLVAGAREAGASVTLADVAWGAADGDLDKAQAQVADLVGGKVAVFVAAGPYMLRLASRATATVPIVAYDFETSPVAAGVAQSMGRPGGNVTGIFLDQPALVGKWIELLRECLPGVARLAVISDTAAAPLQADAVRRFADGLGIASELFEVQALADYAAAFAAARQRGLQAAVLTSSPLVSVNAQVLGPLSLEHRLPTVTMFVEFARAGGLLAYGPSLGAASRRAGFLAGRILAGERPASLPIESPATFDFAVNQRAAQRLGVTLPPSILTRVDEVVE